MMTTVSIDMVGAASGANTVTSLGEAASCRLSEVSSAVNAAAGREGGSDSQVASGEATSLFQKTLDAQASENAALGETIRAALVSVSETLTTVDAAVVRDRGSDVPVAPLDTSVKSDVSIVRTDAIGTIAPTAATDADDTAQNIQLPALPQQIVSNAALDTELTAATASIGETLMKLDAAAVREGGSDFQVASVETTAKPPVAIVSETLPQQIASNAMLDTELTAATAAASDALTTLGISGSAEAAIGASTEAARTSLPLSQPAAASEVEISQSSSVNMVAAEAQAPVIVEAQAPVIAEVQTPVDAEAQTPVNAVAGRERGSDFQVDSEESLPQPEAIDTPEVTADVLVAAGVMPQVTTPVTSVETPVLQSVAAVDAVAAKAATPSADVLIQAASAVADTLLVSPGLLRGQGEVIVQLRPDVLDGTEVKISVLGRQLEVIFQPQTVDMAVLIENCRTQLVQHLAAKIVSFNVSVDVRKKRG